jgi:ABC-type dipeptide/oligopeptide/nickel transport system permease subunit
VSERESHPRRTHPPEARLTTVQRLAERVVRVRASVDPTVAAFRDPARLAYRLFLDALRRDVRARGATAVFLGLGAICLVGAFSPPLVGRLEEALRAPSAVHPFGTDAFGRDVLMCLIQGSIPTLGAGLAGTLGAAAVGVALGALAGFLRGTADTFVYRAIEALNAVPSLLLLLVIQALYPSPSQASLLLAIIFTRWSEIALSVRADVLRVVQLDHVTAARALGASPARVLALHVMPLALSSGGAALSFGFAAVVGLEATVAVVGVGIVHPFAWGAILGGVRDNPRAWWLVAFPALFIALAVFASVLLGEAMRDALDPHLQRGRQR